MATTNEHRTKFVKEKETKNTIKFSERPEKGKEEIIGSLYIQKGIAETLGEEIEVSVKGK